MWETYKNEEVQPYLCEGSVSVPVAGIRRLQKRKDPKNRGLSWPTHNRKNIGLKHHVVQFLVSYYFVKFNGMYGCKKSIFWYLSFNSKTTKHQVSSNTRRKGSPKGRKRTENTHDMKNKKKNKASPRNCLLSKFIVLTPGEKISRSPNYKKNLSSNCKKHVFLRL